MTRLQLDRMATLEAARANRAKESETFRSNREREKETHRSNLEKEKIEAKNADTARRKQTVDAIMAPINGAANVVKAAGSLL